MRRLILGLLVASSTLLLALATTPAQAGTLEAPEITDPSGDHALADTVPLATQFPSADVIKAWVSNETLDSIQFNIQVTGAGTSGPGDATIYNWNFHVTYEGTAVEMDATSTSDQPTPGGAATAASRVGPAPAIIALTVPKTAFPGSAAGSVLTDMHVESTGTIVASPLDLITDRAPDGATFGMDYVMTGGAALDPNDTDGDGLNDTWENDNFGDLNMTGADDPDSDGLNNTAEQDLGTDPSDNDTDNDGVQDGTEVADGTDPLVADTDGDGFNDGAEKAAGTDPLDPNDFPSGTAPPPPTPPGTTPPTTPPGTTPPTTPPTPPADDRTFSEKARDSLEAETDYLAVAGIGAAAVVALSMIGLLGRWGL